MRRSRNTLGLAIGLGLFLTTVVKPATVTVISGDPAGTGFNDPTPASPIGGNTGTTIGQQRMIAFQAAANKWGTTLSSNVTIRVSAIWTSLTCNANSAVLGSAGATEVFRDFAGAPAGSHWYPKALADKIANIDLDSTKVDISANFNVNLGKSGCLTGIFFYLGLDNNHGNNVDLVTVIIHELGHGLGFLTFTDGQSGSQFLNFPSIWDDFLLDNTTNKTWTMMTPAERASSAVNPGHLVWNGGNVTSAIPQVLQPQGSTFVGADSSGRGTMYAPNTYQPGSSVSHFNTGMFPNQIMEPAINGDLPHEVTPPYDLTFSLLKDIGWSAGNSPHLTISKTHAGNFTQGQNGATYTVTVSNQAGAGPTNGEVTVSDVIPSGMFLASMAGAGWSCQVPDCIRSDALNGGASYPPITVTVNVSPIASSPAVNTAVVVGGGAVLASVIDTTVITPVVPDQVTLFAPVNGATGVSRTPSLSWANSTNAISYDLYLGTTSPPGLYAPNLSGTSFTVTSALNSGATYFWKVVAKNGVGSAPASSTWSFTVSTLSLPAQVSLSLPTNGAAGLTTNPSLIWSASANATSYDLYLGTSNPPVLYAQNLAGTSYSVTTALNAGATYFWNVVAKNNAGTAPPSTTWSFSTAAGSGGGAPTLSQIVTCNGFGSVSCTFPAGIGAGDLVAVFVASGNGCSVSTPSNPFSTSVRSTDANGSPLASYYSASVAAGTRTVTISCQVGYSYASALDISGVSVLDRSGAATGQSQFTSVTTAGAVTSANEYVVAAMAASSGSWTLSAGSGYTKRAQFFSNQGAIEDNNVRTGLSGFQTATFNAGDPNAVWGSLILTFKSGVLTPAQVTLLSPANGATNQSTTPSLSWSPSSGATSYNLYLGTVTEPGLFASNLSSTNFTPSTPLNAGTTYYWNVVALNGVGPSPPTNNWTFSTSAATPGQVTLIAPANGAASQSTTPLLSWSAPANATSYDLYLGVSNPPALYASNLAGTSLQVSTTLNAGATYFWNVVAKNSGGSAPASSTWSFAVAPSPPGQVTLNSPSNGAANQSTTPTLSWAAPPGATSYDLYLGTVNPPSIYAQNLSGTSFTVTNALNPAGTYFWNVVAKNSAGPAPASSTWSFGTLSLPAQVTLLSPANGATNQSATLVLSWSASSNATSYDFYLGTANPPPLYMPSVSSTSFSPFSQLTPGTYFWKVVAKNLAGQAPPSSTWSFTTASLPGSVTLISPANGAANQSITPTLTWSASSNATSYDLYLGLVTPSLYIQNLTGTSFTVTTPLIAGNTYVWQVVAKNSAGQAPPSSTWSFTTAAMPAQVTLLSPANGATNQSRTPALSWSASLNATSYDLYLGTTNPPALYGNLSVPNLTLSTALNPGTTYFWNVVAKNSVLSAPASITWSFTTSSSAPPGQVSLAFPTNGATNQATSPILSWSASTGATAYDLYLGASNPPSLYAQNVAGTSYSVTTALNAGTTYFWNVVAKNSVGPAPPSSTWSFGTAAASATPALVQTVNCSGVSPVSCTFPSGVAAGDLVTVFVSSGINCSVSTPSNPFSASVRATDANGNGLASYYSASVAAGTRTVTISCQAGFSYASALEVSGVSALDRSGASSGLSQFTSVTTTAAVTSDTEYVVAAMAASSGSWMPSAGPGYTKQAQFFSNQGIVEDNNVRTGLSGFQTATFNAGDPNAVWASLILTFKATATALPSQATLLSPANGAANQSTTPSLNWSSSNATSYDLYFGTANPPPLYAPGLNSATFTVSNTLLTGTKYYWNVVAKSNAGVAPASSTWSFVTSTPPGTFTLTSPGNAAINQPTTPTLNWSASSNATSYDLYFGPNSPPSLYAPNLTATSFTLNSALNTSTTYFWTVVARNNAGATSATNTWSFITLPAIPSQVTPGSPANGATNISATPNLNWSQSILAASYDLYLGTGNPPPLYAQNVANTNYTVPTPLTVGVTYFWNVVAKNAAGAAPPSSTWSFTVGSSLPAQVTLQFPVNLATNVQLTTGLSWLQSNLATSYDLYLGTTNPPVVYAQNLSASTNTLIPTTPLTPATTYYWQVVAKNVSGSAPPSAIWSFTTAALPGQVTLISPANGAINQPLSLHLSWSAASNATGYQLYFGTTNPPISYSSVPATPTDVLASGLTAGTTYFWKVVATSNAGSGPASSIWSFTTVPPPPLPDQVTLTSPANGATNQPLTPSLSWSASNNATAYDLYLGTSNPPGLYGVNYPTPNVTLTTALNPGATYFWNVVAKNATGSAPPSATWSFRTAAGPANPTLRQTATCSGLSPLSCTFPATTTAGDMAAVFVSTGNGCTIASPGDTYTASARSRDANGINLSSYYSAPLSGGTRTLTISCSGGYLYAAALEISGVSALDQAGASSGFSQFTSVATSGAVTASTEYVVAAMAASSGSWGLTAGTGYTKQLQFFSNQGAVEDNNTRTGLSGIQIATFNAGDPNAIWASVILAFK